MFDRDHLVPVFARLGGLHADSPDLGVREGDARHRVGVDGAAQAEYRVRRGDAAVDPGRMGELGQTAHVPGRPDAGIRGAKFVVDPHIALVIERHSGFLEAEALGVGAPPDGGEYGVGG